MNTPLMDIIAHLENLIKEQYINNTGLIPAYNSIKNYATELLEREMEVITGAFDDGYYSGSNKYTSVISDNGKIYYKQTFTNESK